MVEESSTGNGVRMMKRRVGYAVGIIGMVAFVVLMNVLYYHWLKDWIRAG